MIVRKIRIMVKVSHGTRASGNAQRGFILMTTADEGSPIITVDPTFPAQGILGTVREASLAAVLGTRSFRIPGVKGPASSLKLRPL